MNILTNLFNSDLEQVLEKYFSNIPHSELYIHATNPRCLQVNPAVRFLSTRGSLFAVKHRDDNEEFSRFFIDEDSTVIVSFSNPVVALKLLALSGFGHLCSTYVYDGNELIPFKADLTKIKHPKLLEKAILRYAKEITSRAYSVVDEKLTTFFTGCISSELDNV